MKSKTLITALIIGFFTIAGVKGQETKQNQMNHEKMDMKDSDSKVSEKQSKYACSMKCEGDKTYDKAGSCPKCGMNLTMTESMSKKYACSMHPEINSDQPGDCSKCGMVLVEKKKEQNQEMQHKGHTH